ncbi:MAG: GIY-YIG nuclease family protein, partial [Acidobacteria bacterium]|nr:GIY-YIG nuclease family protein [Acidobacteriota bacterium]
TMAGHAQAAKLRLTDGLPRTPGVYLFRSATGDILYVGKATNLRARVRSYFSGDERRKVGALLRETTRIDHVEHAHPLAAAVHEVRLIHEHNPPYNRQAKDWSRYVYVRLTLHETFPRLSIVRDIGREGDLHLGPLPSRRTAQRVIDAIHTSVPLRRCASRVSARSPRDAACTAAQLGVSMCPCTGAVDPADYAPVVERTVRGLTTEPDLLLAPLADRLRVLAAEERFEEAADVRDRADALSSALRRQRRFDRLRRADHLRIALPDGSGAELRAGRLVRAWGPGDPQSGATSLPFGDHVDRLEIPAPPERLRSGSDVQSAMPPLGRELADEFSCVAAWLDRNAEDLTITHCEGELSSVLPAVRSFSPRRTPVLSPARDH